ncbi:MAG TPA: hypothetical protein PK076_07165 [Saprospiraceae bacterium]|nr:hypothetical protein [Saprospiraceae bacterium]HQW55890.1 hypothetical protein [Saprospiraceae bacterium]
MPLGTPTESNYLIHQEMMSLMDCWIRFVNKSLPEVKRLDAWLKAMDDRHRINQLLHEFSPFHQQVILDQIGEADKQFLHHTKQINYCLRTPPYETESSLTPEDNWYYYRLSNPLLELQDESMAVSA